MLGVLGNGFSVTFWKIEQFFNEHVSVQVRPNQILALKVAKVVLSEKINHYWVVKAVEIRVAGAKVLVLYVSQQSSIEFFGIAVQFKALEKLVRREETQTQLSSQELFIWAKIVFTLVAIIPIWHEFGFHCAIQGKNHVLKGRIVRNESQKLLLL